MTLEFIQLSEICGGPRSSEETAPTCEGQARALKTGLYAASHQGLERWVLTHSGCAEAHP